MKIIIAVATITVFLSLGLLNLKIFGDTLNQEFFKLAIVGLIAEAIIISIYFFQNWKRVWLVSHCFILGILGKKIRFSMSYLYRIKVNDKYLLVRNSNFSYQYQLVGGKYKRLPTTNGVLKEFELEDDTKLSNSRKMKDDFAIFIPANKAIKFIDWFKTGKDREISHWREFYEELIANEYAPLSHELFPYVNYNFVGTVTTPIRHTDVFQCEEILQYDILDLIPTKEQEEALEKLMSEGDTEYYKWAGEKLIDTLGHDEQEKQSMYNIGPHTKWALNMKWSRV